MFVLRVIITLKIILGALVAFCAAYVLEQFPRSIRLFAGNRNDLSPPSRSFVNDVFAPVFIFSYIYSEGHAVA
jgi:hypothetical protein